MIRVSSKHILKDEYSKRSLMLKQIFLTILFVCFNLRCSSSERTPNGDYYNEFIREYAIFFILPNLDLNQFCPPTDQIPILEPGTYTRYMAEGDTYLFDNRARLNGIYTGGSYEYFTFRIQENPGQEIKLTSPECGNSSYEYRAKQDSGQSGKLENIYIGLAVPPLSVKRSNFFTKFTAIFGSGTITFTTPFAQDPPR
ncbi:LIC_10705 family lipoprotein [Leptospira alexanderi]|uniref:LIC_10705 family lipoprotein n=1 Tax=Leptospira alexanderi TaxID=100053 RepID=UPI001591679A|nr:LIC_10705 family lipoprotein [Leptospira alexanderi]